MKTLKRNCVLAVAFSALLCATGCSKDVTAQDIKTADELCSSNGGTKKLTAETELLNGTATCNNGARFYFAEGKAIGSGT